MIITASVSVTYADITHEAISVSDSTYTLPAAHVEYIELVSNVAYTDLSAEVFIDVSGRYKIITDIFVVVDDAVFSFVKAVQDTLSVIDKTALSFSRGSFDTVSAQSLATKDFNKVRRDVFFTSDQIQEFILEKNKFDTVLAVEDLRYSIQKQLSDGVGINDLVGIPDGITFTANKVVSNVISTVDLLSLASSLSKADSSTVTDEYAVSVVKPLSDATGQVTDLYTIVLDKAVSDAATTIENLVFEFQRGAEQDIAVIVDAIANTFATSKSEDVPSVDTQFFVVGQSKEDVVTIVQQLAHSLTKTLGIEQTFVADSQIIYTTKGLQDSVGAADSGVLVMQDYCDLSYFLEDYVGFSRSF